MSAVSVQRNTNGSILLYATDPTGHLVHRLVILFDDDSLEDAIASFTEDHHLTEGEA